MKAHFEYDDILKGIVKDLSGMQKTINRDEKKVLRVIGNIIKQNVISSLTTSDVAHQHLKDDVVIKISTNRMGNQYVSVKGGKETGYKWAWVNDGHLGRDNETIPGTHFVEAAEKKSEAEISSLLDNFANEVIN